MILRSLIFIIFTLPLFCEPLFFKDSYCVESNVVRLKDIFPNVRKDFIILTIPKHTKEYKVPLLKLKKLLQERGFVIDQKNKIISFSLNCINNKYLFLKKYLRDVYKRYYPSIYIKNIFLKTSSKASFSKEDIKKIEISSNSLKREKGFLKVFLKNGKRVHFSYKIEAFIEVLKANRDIKKEESILPSFFSKSEVKFRFFYQKPVTKGNFLGFKAKRFIKEGEILTKNMIKKRGDIEKGERVKAFIKDNGITVSFDAVSLDEGTIGDVIRVKKDKGKIFKGKVVSKNVVEIE